MHNNRKVFFAYWIVIALIAVMTVPINAKEMDASTVNGVWVYENEALMPLSEEDYFSSNHNAPCGCAVNVTMQVRITPNNRIEPLSLTATSEIGKKNDHYVYFELKSYSFSKKTSTSCTVTFTGYEWRSSLDAPNEWWIHDVGVRYSVEIMYPEL